MRESDQQGNWPEENDPRVDFIDSREILAAGREPFPAIMSAAENLETGRMLWLRAPFEPVPLYSVMAGMGFVARSRQGEGEAGIFYWDVLFTRPDKTSDSGDEAGEAGSCSGLVELDLRGVDETLMSPRLVAALDGLRYDDVLLVRHRRAAGTIRPVLAERGFSHRAEESEDDDGLIRVWRNR